MKRILSLICLVVAISATTWAGWENEIRAAMATAIGTIDASSINVVAEGDSVVVTIGNPMLTEKGKKGKEQKPAKKMRIASGILDAVGMDPYITPALEVKEGKVVVRMINYAKAVGVPVVEHIWGVGLFDAHKSTDDGVVDVENPGFLVLDPNNKWVVYKTKKNGEPDLKTLCIGIIMYPDGTIMPLKALGSGKLKQGKHPELAKPNK
ncbi:MAG: hypothetical protein V1649_02265 [Patescibacteria group bacterium]